MRARMLARSSGSSWSSAARCMRRGSSAGPRSSSLKTRSSVVTARAMARAASGERVGEGRRAGEGLALEGRVECLGQGVVRRGTDRAHRLGHPEPIAQRDVCLGGAGRPVVGVEDRPGRGPAFAVRGVQGVGDQGRAHVVGQGPPDELARVQVDDGGHRRAPVLGGRARVDGC